MASPKELRAQIQAIRLELNEERNAHNHTLQRLITLRREGQRLTETINRRGERLSRKNEKLRRKNKKLRKKNRRLERGMDILHQTQEWLHGTWTRICESIRAAFEAV
jgi:hypothetical protein